MAELSDHTTIMISTLPQVTTPEQFFSIERIVIPIAIHLVGAPPYITDEAIAYGGIVYQGETYLLTAIFGSPESLFLNIQQGKDIKIGKISFTYRFHNELDMLLESGTVFDASGFDEPTGFGETTEYYIENCIERNLPPVQTK